MKRIIYLWLMPALLVSSAGCKKYLDVVPKGRIIPNTTEDFRQLLDNNNDLNYSGHLAELASDNLFLTDAEYLSLSTNYARNSFIWAKEVFAADDQIKEWNNSYQRTYVANLVLEGLNGTSTGTPTERNTVKGEALFMRAHAMYNVTQVFCAPWDSATAATTLGAAIRLSSDVFVRSQRGTLQESYDQIIKDLKEAADLMPNATEFKTRPVKPAAYALLSRLFLSAGNYELALDYALKALAINNKLLDYKTVNPMAYPVFPKFNVEMLYYDAGSYDVPYFFVPSFNPVLYNMYSDNDYRKKLYFTATTSNGVLNVERNASYVDYGYFTGLANDELYLTVAECYARRNELVPALQYLNDLLVKRIDNTFIHFDSADPETVLRKILDERRKELAGRNLRWTDLKRLNKDPRFAVTLTRVIAGTTYTLPPNDPRYAYPIPQSVINQTGMKQNPR